ncbi:hypothetical protein GDO81_001128 [Engystomops pustulosus]|uniref:TIR domain-containing protein n=1 Tax=Engystomops pustulosus TaxID=76066 RepID=A0AAV7DDT1_ENGPU|nr:hypothetical protein GDO81_001128 [Engystomops pustulosus]
MLKNNLTSDTDNEPQTLRSDLASNGIPVCRPYHPSSLSLASNPLQISQSPTIGFLREERKSQYKVSGMNDDRQDEISTCGSIPMQESNPFNSANQNESASSISAETMTMEKEMLVSNKNTDEEVEKQEHKLPPKENFSVSPSNLSTGLFHDTSINTSPHAENSDSSTPFSNEAFSPSIKCVASSPTVLPPDLLSSLKFFSFVILHVPEDQEEADRVCGVLNSLEIGEGTTFCEGFETAGVSPLKCLEDAVENSAYIVLLLTTGFLSIWGEFQTNTVLMNSIDDKNKSGTVIPFIPKIKVPIGKIPMGLKSLIPLNEKCRLFEKQALKTFKPDFIKRQKDLWTREQALRWLKGKLEDAKDLSSSALKIQQYLAMDMSALLSNLTLLSQQILAGNGPVIQINNASNVQIGNQNLMNVQQTTNVPQMPGEFS